MPETYTIREAQDLRPEDIIHNEPMFSVQQLMSMETIDADHSEFNEAGFFQSTPDQDIEWRNTGPIGFVEAAQRQDKTQMIPFNPEAAVRAGDLYFAVQRLRADNYGDEPGQKSQDLIKINNYLQTKEEERVRGYSFGGNVARGVAALPGYMIEFLATGGLATAAKGATAKAAQKLVGEATERGVMKFAVQAIGAGAGAGVRTVAMPHRVAEGGFERLLNQGMVVTDKGLEIAKEAQQRPATAFLKSFADVWVENFSEAAGPAITATGKFAGKKFLPKGFSSSMIRLWRRLKPNESVTKLFTASGYNGFIEELGEERLAGFMRAGLNLDPSQEDKPLFDRMAASWPSWDQFAVEATILAVPGVGRMALSQFIDRTESKRLPTFNELSDDVLNTLASEEGFAGPKKEGEGEETANKPEIPESSDILTSLEDFVSGLEGPQTIRSDEGEISRLASGFPEFISRHGVTKKELMNMIKKVREGKPLTQNQEEIFGDILKSFQESTGIEGEVPIKSVAQEKRAREVDKIVKKTEKSLTRKQQVAQAKKDIRATTGVAKPKEKTITERRALREKLRAQARGARFARRFTQREVSATQENLIGVLNESELSAHDKSKFISTIKNIQTPQQLFKQIEEIESRIDRLTASAKSRNLRNKINDELSNVTAKKQAGKPVGKFTPDIQKILDRAKEITKINREEALNRIGAKIEKVGEGVPSFDELLEIKLLEMMSGLEQRTPDELANILNEIQTIKSTGTAEFLRNTFKRKERAEKITGVALDVITGKKPLSKDRIKGFKDKAKKLIKTSYITVVGWNDKMDMLSESDASKMDQSALSKVARVSDQVTAEKKGVRQQAEKVRSAAMLIFGLSDEKQLFRKFNEDSQIKDIGTFTNGFGEIVKLQLSRAEARKRWMELKDPTIAETYTTAEVSEDGKRKLGMGYTEDMIDAIRTFLNQQDMDFIDFQLSFYRDFYESVNGVYSKRYGVDLPFNEFYSPIKRKRSASPSSDEFLKEISYRRSIASVGSLKSRIKNFRPLAEQSDIVTLIKHINEMEHFKNWADKIDDLNSIFSDGDVREAIEEKFGKPMLASIDKHIQDFTRGGIDRANNLAGIELLRINLTKSVLAIKPSITVKQMVSFVAYAETIPTKAFIEGVAEFVNDPVGKSKILMESELMKSRSKDLTRDIKSVSNSESFATFRRNPTFWNSLLLNVRMGDKGAILLGGWSVYRHARKKGKTHEQALREFERVTANTQQSGDIDQLSDWQRGGSFAKLFTMFTSAQNQYFRREVGAVRNLMARRVTLAEFTKKVAIYHFVLPMLFQWVVDFGTWDEKHQWRAALFGSLNGIFILNDMLEAALGALFDEKVFSAETPIQTVSRGVVKAINHLQAGEVIDAIKDLSTDTIGPATGLPIKQVFNAAEGVADISDDDVHKGILKLMGYSSYSVNQGFKKRKPKRKTKR